MALLSVLPFAASLGAGFVFDDHPLIEEREAVHSLARLPELLRGEFWEGLSILHFRYLRPLVSASFAVDWALWGGNPFGFHLTNLVVHATVSALLFGLLYRLSRAPWGAFLAALAWAVHPSKVEAVSWIAGRTDLLCALGILLACTGVHLRLTGTRGRGIFLEIVGVLVAFGSKEHAVVLGAFVALEAWAHLRFADSARGEPREARSPYLASVLKITLPYVAVAALYLGVRALVLPIVPERAGTLSFVDARLYGLETLGEFAKVLLLPAHFSIWRAPLRFDSSLHFVHSPLNVALGAFALVAMTAGIALAWRGKTTRWRAASALAGVAALLPVANVLAPKMVFLFAERFAYLPLIGLAAALVPGPRVDGPPSALDSAGALPGAPPSALRVSAVRAAWGAAAAVVVGWAALSVHHTEDFHDDQHLWEHELSEDPTAPLPLRWACDQAMREHRNRDALSFAVRGYQATAHLPIGKPERIEFAAKGARLLELLTLDKDRDTLDQVATFFRTLLEGQGIARIKTAALSVAIDAAGQEAIDFRQGSQQRASALLWRSIAAARAGRCEEGEAAARTFLTVSQDVLGRVSVALVLARCGSLDDARAVAAHLPKGRAANELVKNLDWVKDAATHPSEGLEGALAASRARTLLLDRRGALEALLPYREAVLADPEGAIHFARLAFAAGEDETATDALSTRVSVDERATLLAKWTRELGRE